MVTSWKPYIKAIWDPHVTQPKESPRPRARQGTKCNPQGVHPNHTNNTAQALQSPQPLHSCQQGRRKHRQATECQLVSASTFQPRCTPANITVQGQQPSNHRLVCSVKQQLPCTRLSVGPSSINQPAPVLPHNAPSAAATRHEEHLQGPDGVTAQQSQDTDEATT